MLIPSIDCNFLQDPQKMHQIRNVWALLYSQCKLNEGFKMYIAAGFCQNLKLFFVKNAWFITEKWKRAMPPNHTLKIVRSSAMYYQNLIVIHESSKKLLTIKSVKCFFNTYYKHISSFLPASRTHGHSLHQNWYPFHKFNYADNIHIIWL